MIIGGLCPVKKLFLPLFVLAVCTLVGCCVNSKVRHPEGRATVVDELRSETVALVHRDDDNDVATFCTGVWVAPDQILTADHCAKAPVQEVVMSMAGDVDTDDEKVVADLKKQIEDLEDGFQINYITADDSTGVYKEPKTLRVAKVLRHDTAHDLALLVVKDAPAKHVVAPLAGEAPAVGEHVRMMGHPTALVWTYAEGYVAAYREEKFRPIENRGKLGPFMQIAGEQFRGNSGGGCYNEAGELVGIASFIPPMPNETFFVHIDTIKAFLASKR